MTNIKTLGIIIKRSNLGEADRILTVFTKDFGKLKAIAKGVRKINSRLAGNLEPYSLSDFIFHEGKTFETVISTIPIRNSQYLADSCHDFATAHYFGELIDKLLPEKEKQPEIFEIFRAAISRICNDDNEFLRPFFELKILDRLGYSPQVYYCVHCRKKLLAGQNYFSAAEGGVICSECPSLGLPSISTAAIKALRIIVESEISIVDRLDIGIETVKELEKILDLYQKYIIEKELNSKEFLNRLDKEDGE